MKTILIDKGWMPDLAAFGITPGGLLKALNILPFDDSYRPARNKSTYSSSSLSDTSRSAIEFRDNAGNRRVFIGTADDLLRLETNKSITEVSKAATSYGTGDNTWSFEKFGEWVIATNFAYAPQVLKGMSAANFADLGGSPAKAKFCLLVNGHLVMGYLNDGTVYPNKLQIAASEDPEDWTPSVLTGAQTQILYDALGPITGMGRLGVGGDFAVLHEDSITIGQWTGYPYRFGFIQSNAKNKGGISHGSIVPWGGGLFYWGFDDLYFYNGRGDPESLGTGKVKRTIFDLLNIQYAYRISAAHDPANGLIYWAYPTTASAGNSDRVLVFNYRKQIFTHLEIDVECLFSMYLGGQDMDSLDAAWPSMDDIPYGMDSAYWLANNPIIAAIDPDNSKVATLNGDAMTGTLETGEFQHSDENGPTGAFTYIKSVRPRFKGLTDTPSVRLGHRRNEDDSVTYTASKNRNSSSGKCDVKAENRLMRVEVSTQEHEGLFDIQIDAERSGEQ